MLTVNLNHPLAQTGKSYLQNLYLSTVTKPLSSQHVTFIVSPRTSQLTIRSLPYTVNNDVGVYRGEHTVFYTKSDLGKVLPMPLIYRGGWPTTYKNFCTWMWLTYRILLEEGEFELNGVPLTENVIMSLVPDANDLVRLTATADSIRWRVATQLALRVVKMGSQSSIAALVAQGEPGDMANLAPL